MPPNTIYVGRPTKWGNPYIVGTEMVIGRFGDERRPHLTAAEAVEEYRFHLPHRRHLDLRELRGKNLACWCPLDQPCHADVLLELANR